MQQPYKNVRKEILFITYCDYIIHVNDFYPNATKDLYNVSNLDM